MEPTRNGGATLVDLLDRVLDRGLVINADIIISLAGVALVAVSLRAAVASVETMWSYGLMKDLIQSYQPLPAERPSPSPRHSS